MQLILIQPGLRIGLQHIQPLPLTLINAPNQQHGPKLTLLELLNDDQLIQPVDGLVTLLYLLVGLGGSKLLGLLDNRVQVTADDLPYDVGF